MDPFSAKVGLTAPRLQADLFLFSEDDNEQIPGAQLSQGFVVSCAGEYEHSGVLLRGIPTTQVSTGKKSVLSLFTAGVEGVTLGFLGALNHQLSNGELEHLENVDILFVPIGGKSVFDAVKATEVISQIEPRVVIPYYYKVPKLTVSLDGPEKFMKEMGLKSGKPEEKFKVTKRDLPEQDMQTVFLSA